MNGASEKFTINLHIGNSTFPITTLREDEEVYRKAEKMINHKLNQYATRYPSLGTERYMMMVMLDLAVSQVRLDNRNDTEPFREVMRKLQSEIEATLGRDK